MAWSKDAADFTTPVARGLLVVPTGTWRQGHPVTEQKKCWLCGTCWLFCPTQSRVEAGKFMDTNLDYCKGCGICANECPSGAVRMEAETAGGD